MIFPVLYKISYWCEDREKEIITQGIIYAESFMDASAQIANWYGDNNISSLEIHLLEYQLFEITKDEFEAFLKRS